MRDNIELGKYLLRSGGNFFWVNSSGVKLMVIRVIRNGYQKP